MLANLIEHFTEGIDSELNVGDSYRARLLIESSFVCAILLAPFTLVWAYLSDAQIGGQVYFLIITHIALLTTPFVLQFTRSIRVSGAYLNLLSTVTLVGFSYSDGGLNSTAMPWYPVLPLFGAFFSGKKYGLFVSSILIAVLLTFFYLHQLDQIPVSTLAQSTLGLMYTASAASAIVIILFVAFSYLNWQESVREQLIKANNAKNDFLSEISHELRTPLNSIVGFSEVLNKNYVGNLNQKQIKFVDNINSSGEHLLQLVNDLLDISKIEAGEMSFNPGYFNLHELCVQAKSMVKGSASKKNITLELQTLEIENSVLWIDGTKIKQVLLNLLSNAIKFSPDNGRVILAGSTRGSLVEFSVEDAGPGVPMQLRESIFVRFFQAHSKNADKAQGTGLGLSISKHFVEMHNGHIQLCESSTGAKFKFTLPADSTDECVGPDTSLN